jgi:hypothetical protein
VRKTIGTGITATPNVHDAFKGTSDGVEEDFVVVLGASEDIVVEGIRSGPRQKCHTAKDASKTFGQRQESPDGRIRASILGLLEMELDVA